MLKSLWNLLRSIWPPAANVQTGRLGDLGETAAVRFLKSKRYRILATRMRNAFGEIDIIAADGRTLVFVEVKTRSSTDEGKPFEAVDKLRQERMTRAALAWLKHRRRLEQPARFDIVSIVWARPDSEPEITHYINAFEATGRGQMFG